MLIGHFGVGLALKRADRHLSLGLLFIAVQLPDLIFGVNLLIGIGKMNVIEGSSLFTSVEYVFFPYSHSLVAVLFWAGLVALIFLLAPYKASVRKGKIALVIVTAVLSHFFLDAIVHNSDLDLLGNGVYKIGFGLWNYPLVSYTAEALLLISGSWIYLRSKAGKDLRGKYGVLILSLILLALNAIFTFSSPLINSVSFALTISSIYLGTIAIGFWLTRKEDGGISGIRQPTS
jgi:hypothetical protein